MDLNDILKNFSLDAETLAAVFNEETAPYFAELLGLDERLITVVFKILPVALSGELDFKQLIPALLPTLISFIASKKQNAAPEESIGSDEKDIERDSLVEDFLKEENSKEFSPLSVYLQNSSASENA